MEVARTGAKRVLPVRVESVIHGVVRLDTVSVERAVLYPSDVENTAALWRSVDTVRLDTVRLEPIRAE